MYRALIATVTYGLLLVLSDVKADLEGNLNHEAEARLDRIEHRLDVFEEKLVKVDALLESFEELCTFLSRNRPADKIYGEDGSRDELDKQRGETIEDGDDVYRDEVAQRKSELRLVSIESKSLKDKKINASVVVLFHGHCELEWRFHYNSTLYRSRGLVYRALQWDRSTKYETFITLPDIELDYVGLVIQSSVHSAIIDFNITALQVEGEQYIGDDIDHKVLEYNQQVTVPDTLEGDWFDTTIKVSDNVVEGMNSDMYHPSVAMAVINSTTTPPSLIHIWTGFGDHQNISVTVKPGSTNELIVRLHKRFAQLGGLLELRLRQEVSGYMRGIEYGVEMRIVNERIGDVMPPGTLGIYPAPALQYITGTYMSIMCYSFGNTSPDVKMFKVKKDGRLVELEADYTMTHAIYTVSVLEFHPEKKGNPAGKYLCKASNGVQTLDHEMTYELFETVEIDTQKSTLTKNTTDKTVVTCKARGKPLPQLELRGNHREFGKDLLETVTGRYSHTLKTRNHVAKVTLTISPPDNTLRSVYCIANQPPTVSHGRFRDTKVITILNQDEEIDYPFYNDTIPFYDGY